MNWFEWVIDSKRYAWENTEQHRSHVGNDNKWATHMIYSRTCRFDRIFMWKEKLIWLIVFSLAVENCSTGFFCDIWSFFKIILCVWLFNEESQNDSLEHRIVFLLSCYHSTSSSAPWGPFLLWRPTGFHFVHFQLGLIMLPWIHLLAKEIVSYFLRVFFIWLYFRWLAVLWRSTEKG